MLCSLQCDTGFGAVRKIVISSALVTTLRSQRDLMTASDASLEFKSPSGIAVSPTGESAIVVSSFFLFMLI